MKIGLGLLQAVEVYANSLETGTVSAGKFRRRSVVVNFCL